MKGTFLPPQGPTVEQKLALLNNYINPQELQKFEVELGSLKLAIEDDATLMRINEVNSRTLNFYSNHPDIKATKLYGLVKKLGYEDDKNWAEFEAQEGKFLPENKLIVYILSKLLTKYFGFTSAALVKFFDYCARKVYFSADKRSIFNEKIELNRILGDKYAEVSSLFNAIIAKLGGSFAGSDLFSNTITAVSMYVEFLMLPTK